MIRVWIGGWRRRVKETCIVIHISRISLPPQSRDVDGYCHLHRHLHTVNSEHSRIVCHPDSGSLSVGELLPGEEFGKQLTFFALRIEAAIEEAIDSMARFFQQYLADHDGAGAIGDPIGVEIDALTTRGAHGGIGAEGAMEFGIAAQFHREAEAIAGQLELQSCNALIQQVFIGASRAENLFD